MIQAIKKIERPEVFIPFRKSIFAMPRTIDQDPLQKFMFRVIIPEFPEIGFTKVAGLSREIGVTEYLEGMYQYAHKLAGREKINEITLERGAYYEQEPEKVLGFTLQNHLHRTTITIQILNRFKEVRRQYILAEAWCNKVEIGDLDATSDEVIVDKMTIQFEYFL